MVNSDDFVKRLEKILQYYSLSASAFADKIGVQRSSVSHLLSGRNNPSLDFILKLLEVFPEIDLYWILNGKGNFPKEPKIDDEIAGEKLVEHQPTLTDIIANEVEIKNQDMIPEAKKNLDIEKIVIFYNNGTFKEYQPQ
ncbi:helix-turn-helix domain-containing protein [Flavobacterium sp. NST-5]|uniref:Helix-turn-helix domain-containing protein n=1 Tax=Flavobacterium ichthyis TaxID=2698827 RepID=A0ABW9ZBP6_9FLAO|nr:helix-turn-helix transcriptional regulator [Flavobacterium ichthyis]NBL65209.1 helix-turn-helix domain-containing protein [Flavobacterium ichthyis]